MEKIIWYVLIISTVSIASACGASNAQKAGPSPTPDSSVKPRTEGNITGKLQVNGNGNQNVVRIPNSGVLPPPSIGSPSSPIEHGRSRRDRVDVDPSATPPPPTYQAAPENSEFAIQMEKGGGVVETRLFKNHPQLRKAEIKWLDPKTRSLWVTLKNGKVVERPAAGVTNLRTISTTELLNMVGVKPVQK
jgi:hypothetical protein